MAVVKPKTREEIDATAFYCPHCGWRGKGAAADVQLDNLVRCPDCREALEREE